MLLEVINVVLSLLTVGIMALLVAYFFVEFFRDTGDDDE